MEVKQVITAILSGLLFIAAAGCVETQPLVCGGLLIGMGVCVAVGRLGRRRNTLEGVLREWSE